MLISYFPNKYCKLNFLLDGEITTAASTLSSTTVDTSLVELQEIGPFTGHHHGVSGTVYIIDAKRLRIVGFAYDGKYTAGIFGGSFILLLVF